MSVVTASYETILDFIMFFWVFYYIRAVHILRNAVKGVREYCNLLRFVTQGRGFRAFCYVTLFKMSKNTFFNASIFKFSVKNLLPPETILNKLVYCKSKQFL